MAENKENLSKEELSTIMEFASGLYETFNGYGYYTPFMQNQNLIGLNNTPSDPDYDKILKALKKSPIDTSKLQAYSEFMQVFDTIYGKTLEYYSNILAFDLSMKCINVKSPSEWKSKEYEEDVRRVYKFLNNFNYKGEFKKVVSQIVRTGVSFGCLRDSYGTFKETPIEVEDDIIDEREYVVKKKQKFALQMLPQKYCLLTGYFDNGLLFDFNYNYFMQGTVDIDLFPPSMRSDFNTFSKNSDTYNPASQLDVRDGQFSMYKQVSPNDGFWVWKYQPNNFRIIPPFASLMKTAITNTEIERLQYDKDMISAYALLLSEIRLMKNNNSAKKNDFAIDPKTVGQMLQLVQSGLIKNVKTLAMPTEETKYAQFVDNSPLMSQYQYRSSSSQGASASGLIYSTERMAQFELENAIMTDYNMMSDLYEQFNHFMNFYINKKTKKYKFNFTFKGSTYPFEREKRRKSLIELADKGLLMEESEWASVMNMSPQDFHYSLEQAHNSNFTNNLTLLLNINTTKDGSSTQQTNQTKEIEELNENGATAREYK